MNPGLTLSRIGMMCVLLCILVLSTQSSAQQRYSASGLITKIDPSHHRVVISCNDIPGYMDAMTMPLSVRTASALKNLTPGTMVDFTLVVEKDAAFAESIHAHPYQGLEPDPTSARRLKLLAKAAANSTKPLAIGDKVPNFTLNAQDARPTSLADFDGKVIALDFIYTRCALPNFCVRSSNNFGALQKRFSKHLKTDLVLITITFDPVHDTPDTLAKYSAKFGADPSAWYFLTGSDEAIRRVCDLFGEDYFPDEGLLDHSLHTAIINREGTLVANLEGNEFTSQQLGDLVQAVLDGGSKSNSHLSTSP